MTDQTCAYACSVPVTTTALCKVHAALLGDTADELAWLCDQLHVAETRQVSFARTSRGGGASQIPFNPSAEKQADRFAGLLLGWQADLADWLGVAVRFTTARAAGEWLAGAVRDGRTIAWPRAGELLTSLRTSVDRALLTIDRPADTWFAGRCDQHFDRHDETSCTCDCHAGQDGEDRTPCDICSATWEDTCSQGLYASNERGFITCPACHTTHDVAARRRALLTRSKTYALTATEIALAVVTWGDMDITETRLRNRIKQWQARGRIQPSGHLTERGQLRPIYRLGAVMALLDEDRERRLKRPRAV